MRILIAECIHEVCSFNPIPTKYDDFLVHRRGDMLKFHQHIGSEISGAIGVFAQRPDIEVIPTFSARGIASGGDIPMADFKRIVNEFLDDLRHGGHADAAYFALHGAMSVVGEDDPEGYLLAEARKILGEKIPIVASFDLHGILTDRMLQHTDAIVLYHTYPHVDFRETGERGAKLLLRILSGEVKPITAKVEIPALVRGDELITKTGIYGGLIRQAQDFEKAGGLAAGIFIGNPFTDVPELRCYTVLCADGDANLAGAEAVRLANEFWPNRAKMQAKLTPIPEAVQLALRTPGTVVLIDAADATSSGAPGDGVEIVRGLLDAGYRGRILAPVVDESAVDMAFHAGIGGQLRVALGGNLDPSRQRPIELDVKVRMLSDGWFRSESFNAQWYGGKTVVLESGNAVFVVTSRPVHLFDRSLFLAHGQNPCNFNAVIVKSPHCQPHMYAEWCDLLINVDAPGSTSANLPTLGHTICRRPVYPLETDLEFVPKVKFFSRSVDKFA